MEIQASLVRVLEVQMAVTTKKRLFTTLTGRAATWLTDASGLHPARMLRAPLIAMLALLAVPAVSAAQQSKKIPRLCFLTFEPGTLQMGCGTDS